MSTNNIKMTLNQLNDKMEEEDFHQEQFYESYLELAKKSTNHFFTHSEEATQEATQEVAK